MKHDAIHLEPALVDANGAAQMLGVSRSHLLQMDRTGRLGPRGILHGRSRRWVVQELREWAANGCAPRLDWEKIRTQQDK